MRMNNKGGSGGGNGRRGGGRGRQGRETPLSLRKRCHAVVCENKTHAHSIYSEEI